MDASCEIKIDKNSTTAEKVKQMVGDILKSDGTYRDMLQQEWDKCWTLEYADVNGIGFCVDIVPAVPEDDSELKTILEDVSTNADVYQSQIAITNKKNSEYMWQTSNPKAYQNWFKQVNEPFLINKRRRLEKAYGDRKFALNESTVEKIPENQERSALQRVIQIVKYHADVYYSKGGIKKYKSASIVITTLMTLLAQEADSSLDIFSLLTYIVGQLEIYGENLTLNESAFVEKYQNKNVIKRVDGHWILRNPLNPCENLVDSWNEDPQKPIYFFQWVKILKSDYLTALDADDDKFIAILENNFGRDYIQKSLDLTDYTNRKPININISTKPYRC